jgi:hypothetical protein
MFYLDHALHWLLLLEEYGVTFEYLPGKKQKNVIADVLSLLHNLKLQGSKGEASINTSLRIIKPHHQ